MGFVVHGTVKGNSFFGLRVSIPLTFGNGACPKINGRIRWELKIPAISVSRKDKFEFWAVFR